MSIDKSFRALNRYTCRKVLDILRRGPMSVGETHSRMNMGTRASVSQAFAVLLKAGMVSVQRQGRNNIYQLRSAPFQEVGKYCNALAQHARRSTTT